MAKNYIYANLLLKEIGELRVEVEKAMSDKDEVAKNAHKFCEDFANGTIETKDFQEKWNQFQMKMESINLKMSELVDAIEKIGEKVQLLCATA